jgi:hypothetical protein
LQRKIFEWQRAKLFQKFKILNDNVPNFFRNFKFWMTTCQTFSEISDFEWQRAKLFQKFKILNDNLPNFFKNLTSSMSNLGVELFSNTVCVSMVLHFLLCIHVTWWTGGTELCQSALSQKPVNQTVNDQQVHNLCRQLG